MKYNIVSVLNEAYFPFGQLLVGSIFDKITLEQINKIIIYDTGLSDDSRSYFKNFPQVEIISSGFQTEYGRVHDDHWQKNVYSKAALLLNTLKDYETFIPSVLIDSDCFVVENFLDRIQQEEYDVGACLRSKAGRAKRHQADSSHIGSFFVANTSKSIPFIDDWISYLQTAQEKQRIGKLHPKPLESPALSDAIQDWQGKIKLVHYEERLVANVEMTPPEGALIYHLKSDWLYMTIEKRLAQPRARYYTQRYLK